MNRELESPPADPEAVAAREALVSVRGLRAEDLEAVVAIDARHVGRRREAYFRTKLAQNLLETGIRISLAGETESRFAGFLLARVYYGEFGLTEPVAVLDTLGVDPDLLGRGVAGALLAQLRRNLMGLGVRRVETEVSWDAPRLLAFFQHAGFRPAPRIALDLELDRR